MRGAEKINRNKKEEEEWGEKRTNRRRKMEGEV